MKKDQHLRNRKLTICKLGILVCTSLFFIHCDGKKNNANSNVEDERSISEHEARETLHLEQDSTLNLDRVKTSKLIAYLGKLGLLNVKRSYSLYLTNNEFMINGRKQSQELHDYIMEHFVNSPDKPLTFEHSMKID